MMKRIRLLHPQRIFLINTAMVLLLSACNEQQASRHADRQYCEQLVALDRKYAPIYEKIWQKPIDYHDMTARYEAQVKVEHAQLKELMVIRVDGAKSGIASEYVTTFKKLVREDADIVRRFRVNKDEPRFTLGQFKKLRRLAQELKKSCE